MKKLAMLSMMLLAACGPAADAPTPIAPPCTGGPLAWAHVSDLSASTPVCLDSIGIDFCAYDGAGYTDPSAVVYVLDLAEPVRDVSKLRISVETLTPGLTPAVAVALPADASYPRARIVVGYKDAEGYWITAEFKITIEED